MTFLQSRLSIIVAVSAPHRVIGNKGKIPWRIPADMAHFKEVTMGHPVIMGRKTWESLPSNYCPLPGRSNIVITNNLAYSAPGAHVLHTLEDAVAAAREMEGGEEVLIIGGAAVYAEALPYVDRLYLTIVHREYTGDTSFPKVRGFGRIISEEKCLAGDPAYTFLTLER